VTTQRMKHEGTKARRTERKNPFTAEQEKTLKGWAERYPARQMGLVEALRAVQEWHRRIPQDAVFYLADLFQLPVNWVHSTATFFPTFTQEPTGRHRLGICHGLSCWLAGSDAAEACLTKTLGVGPREVTKDGRLSWEPMECLGACEQAPALQVDDRLQGKATDALIEKLARDLK
jgi:NADH-quinone oxidoreductase subunit E